jgi:hypothetical protein
MRESPSLSTLLWHIPGRIVSEWNLQNGEMNQLCGFLGNLWRWNTRRTLDGVPVRPERLESSFVRMEPGINGAHRFHRVTLVNNFHKHLLQQSFFLFFFLKETTPQGNVGPGIWFIVRLKE